MKSLYKNSLGEEVKINVVKNNFILYVKDEENNEAEICIPAHYAFNIAIEMLQVCKGKC